MSTILYGIMAAIGLTVMRYVHGNLASSLAVTGDAMSWGKVVLAGALCAGALLCISYFFEQSFASFRALKELVQRMLGRAPWPSALYLATVSAVGEELLFRGAMQPALGLILTSIIFGLMHLGPGGRISSWSAWAFLAGLLMGWMVQETGQLWSAIVAHFLVNATSLLRLRREFQRQLAEGAGTCPPPPVDEAH